MADFFHPMTEQKSRKVQQCVCCYHAIERGESYCKQTGVWEGDYFTNRFHRSCWDVLTEDANFEFTPGEGDPPEGARTMQEARLATHAAPAAASTKDEE